MGKLMRSCVLSRLVSLFIRKKIQVLVFTEPVISLHKRAVSFNYCQCVCGRSVTLHYALNGRGQFDERR